MGRRLDLAGKRFGSVVVIRELGILPNGAVLWAIKCDCGRVGQSAAASIKNGTRSRCHSCGISTKITHGLSKTPIYRRWRMMITRCTNPNMKSFPNYGGRGISVCKRWLKFENFLADMGMPPARRTIERKDNDGNYEPTNCRWATAKEQCLNRRPRRMK